MTWHRRRVRQKFSAQPGTQIQTLRFHSPCADPRKRTSEVEGARGCEGEGIEAFVAVEGIRLFGSLQSIDNAVSERRRDDLISYLKGVAGSDHVEQRCQGNSTGKGEKDHQHRIHSLTDDG